MICCSYSGSISRSWPQTANTSQPRDTQGNSLGQPKVSATAWTHTPGSPMQRRRNREEE